MSSYIKTAFNILLDPTTNQPVGLLGHDGQEYLFPLPVVGPSGSALTDASGTPGAATINANKGRVAIAAGAGSVVITDSTVTANSVIVAHIDQAAADATLLYIARIVPAAGSFTIYGNANATANTTVRFAVLN